MSQYLLPRPYGRRICMDPELREVQVIASTSYFVGKFTQPVERPNSQPQSESIRSGAEQIPAHPSPHSYECSQSDEDV